LLLVLEDSQWLDNLSHDLLEAMGRALWTLPVLLLLAYRPPQPDQRLVSIGRGLPHFTELVLGELAAEEAEQLIRSRMRERVKNKAALEVLVRQVLSRTQGNPFYMEELLTYLLEHTERLNDVAALAEVRWPLSLESLILSRLDQLGEREQLTLKVASIIGRSFQESWLWGYYPALGTPEAVQTMLAALTQTTLLAQEQAEPERVYLFRQVLTQEVTYQSLAAATRSLLHEQLAHFLESTSLPPSSLDLLAYHYARSENLDKKRELLWQAGEAAQRAYANAAACSYYEQLLPLLDTPEAQGDLRRRLGDVAELMGEYESAETHYQAALALAEAAGDGLARLRSQWRLGQLLEKRGAYEAVLRWREQLHQQAALLPSVTTAHAEWSQVRLITGRTLTRQGAYEAAWAELEEGLALARQGGNQDAVALALTYLGNVALYQGKYEAARGLYEESLRHRQALGDKRGIARALNTLGNVIGAQGEAAECALYEEALALQRELGDKWGMAASLTNLGVFAQQQEEYEEADSFYEESLLLWRELGEKGNIALLLNNRGSLASSQGAYARARVLHTEGLALAREIGERRQILYGLLGVAVVETGAPGGNMVRGTRLASVVDQVLRQMGAVLEPLAENFMKQTISAARTALDEETFVAAWMEGQSMTLEDAVAVVLADANHSPPAG
ncbi:MAG: tetratricopeptide repeat protein, partial [Ardenticatenales bacterium]|nr:tetratricopeptide repeat protein [Ardenticatenales bacterium]